MECDSYHERSKYIDLLLNPPLLISKNEKDEIKQISSIEYIFNSNSGKKEKSSESFNLRRLKFSSIPFKEETHSQAYTFPNRKLLQNSRSKIRGVIFGTIKLSKLQCSTLTKHKSVQLPRFHLTKLSLQRIKYTTRPYKFSRIKTSRLKYQRQLVTKSVQSSSFSSGYRIK